VRSIDVKDVVVEVDGKLTEIDYCGELFDGRTSTD